MPPAGSGLVASPSVFVFCLVGPQGRSQLLPSVSDLRDTKELLVLVKPRGLQDDSGKLSLTTCAVSESTDEVASGLARGQSLSRVPI